MEQHGRGKIVVVYERKAPLPLFNCITFFHPVVTTKKKERKTTAIALLNESDHPPDEHHERV